MIDYISTPQHLKENALPDTFMNNKKPNNKKTEQQKSIESDANLAIGSIRLLKLDEYCSVKEPHQGVRGAMKAA